MVWEFEANRAEEALSTRPDFLLAVRRLAGEHVDEYTYAIVFSEVVGNVMRHAPGPIRLELYRQGEDLVLTVSDRGPGFLPCLDEPDLTSENGRGLFIV
ncbi:MAG: ATP-binding protein, partial [Candidatus Eremiobacteraeota bacterium]|nr:ATP-binding protein [Candidatus Eremiobacteraeota bacterium]